MMSEFVSINTRAFESLEAGNLTANETLVLLRLVALMNSESYKWRGTAVTLAEHLGCALTLITVRRAIQSLTEKGYITTNRQQGSRSPYEITIKKME
jgi:DNA-binding MarR family transcriptional regulator